MKKTYEESLKQLKELSEKVKDPNIGIEESMKYYEEGIKLGRELTSALEKNIRKIEIINLEPEDEPKTEEYTLEEV